MKVRFALNVEFLLTCVNTTGRAGELGDYRNVLSLYEIFRLDYSFRNVIPNCPGVP